MHYGYYEPDYVRNIYNVITSGLKENDYDKIRPFLILFQHFIEACQADPKNIYSQSVGEFLVHFFRVVDDQSRYYQWMEVVIDWVIKVTFRVPLMANWMIENNESWLFLIDWLKQNPFPPMQ